MNILLPLTIVSYTFYYIVQFWLLKKKHAAREAKFAEYATRWEQTDKAYFVCCRAALDAYKNGDFARADALHDVSISLWKESEEIAQTIRWLVRRTT